MYRYSGNLVHGTRSSSRSSLLDKPSVSGSHEGHTIDEGIDIDRDTRVFFARQIGSYD